MNIEEIACYMNLTKNINDVYGKALDEKKVRRWFSKLKSGNFDLEDAPKSERRSAIDDQVLRDLVEEDPRVTLDEIAETLGAPRSTIFDHLKSIDKKCRKEDGCRIY